MSCPFKKKPLFEFPPPMAPPYNHRNNHHVHNFHHHITAFVQSTSSNLSSLFSHNLRAGPGSRSGSGPGSGFPPPHPSIILPLPLPFFNSTLNHPTHNLRAGSGPGPGLGPGSGFPDSTLNDPTVNLRAGPGSRLGFPPPFDSTPNDPTHNIRAGSGPGPGSGSGLGFPPPSDLIPNDPTHNIWAGSGSGSGSGSGFPNVILPVTLPFSSHSTHNDPTRNVGSGYGSGFPSMVRVGGLRSNGGGNGPAFVGQVFSMCDITGTGLMAVSTHFHIPFFSNRTPEWIKSMFSALTKNESGPVFRFFVDLGDAVSYVKKLNIPSGVVGACRLDLAYEHFKEKPHLFQFVPNSKQVKAASKLLKGNKNSNRGRIDGVPVFSAQNLDIAIATPEGIKWYTPYFFDKNILDNILEESIDQHFHTLIQSRHVHRRRDVIDDNVAAEIIEESAESIWEPTEVQELMDEMGQPSIPLSVISKAAEMQLSYAVDRMLLGNKWLRKATGIQPKFPYMVDSFERRSAVSQLRAFKMSTCSSNSDTETLNELPEQSASTKLRPENKDKSTLEHATSHSERKDWLRLPWLKRQHEQSDSRVDDESGGYMKEEIYNNPLLPRITMVGIATSEPGQMNKATIKKTMEDLSKELEQEGQGNSASKNSGNNIQEDRDPLFVANVGDYYSNMGKTSSPRWLRGIHR